MLTQAPKGTYDVLPSDSGAWQAVEQVMRQAAALAGYREVRTPVFEHTELFQRGVGDTTDVVQKEMYTFLDKGGRSITLKPEGTAGAVRAMIEAGLYAGVLPVKLYYLNAPIFRYEAPQSGRMREHHQFGIEVFGASQPSCDAEVMALAMRVLRMLDVGGLTVNINSIGCRQCRPAYNTALREYLASNQSDMCKSCRERMEINPLRTLDCKEESCRDIVSGAPVMLDCLCDDCAVHFDGLKGYLETAGIEYTINPHIVRGLDYYTKTVFEIISTDIGAQGTVCGGGRYDALVQELGGPSTPGIGFGMGLERLLLVLESLGIALPEAGLCDVCICTMGQAAALAGFQAAALLREAGIKAECDHMGRSLKAQLKYAAKLGAKFVAIIGEDELAKGAAVVRDMQKSEEQTVPLAELNSYIKAGIQ